MFVFLIAIVLFNLLNGLAVSDTADILCKAELIGLISRVYLLSYMEDIVIGEALRYWSCYNSSCSLSRWNLFGSLARKILLFPHYLSDGKISIELHENLDGYDSSRNYGKYIRESTKRDGRCTTLTMDSNIIKKAKRIICNRGKLSDNENIIIALNKMQEKLETMEDTLNTIKLAFENNNINNTMESIKER